MVPTVYIFRGAPASGKGTIVPKFCKLLPGPVALIEQDKFRWGFHLINRQVQDIKDEEHVLAYKNMLSVFKGYLKNGNYDIVLEGLFTWDDITSNQGNIKQLTSLAHKYGYTTKNIVLIADKVELLKRNSERSYSVPRDEFETLYGNIYKTINEDDIIIDSTNKTLEETLKLIKTAIGI